MDDDTADLVRQLCTRAGMMMEDVSARAICVGQLKPDQLVAIIAEIESASRDIASLANAARALIDR